MHTVRWGVLSGLLSHCKLLSAAVLCSLECDLVTQLYGLYCSSHVGWLGLQVLLYRKKVCKFEACIEVMYYICCVENN